MNIQRILAAIDLEQHSDAVVAAGLRLASRFSARLTLLHVSESMPYFSPEDIKQYPSAENAIARYRTLAEDKLKGMTAGFKSDVEVRSIVTEGRPVDYILDAVDGGAQDLLLVGTHGRRGFEHLLLGSNASRLVRQSPVPVFVVPTRRPELANLELKTILLASDYSDNARHAEPWAVALARAFGAELVLIHVVEERFHPYLPYHVSGVEVAASHAGYFSAVSERYKRLSTEVVARLTASGLKARSLLVEDAPSVTDGLLKAVGEVGAQLLVVGTHGRTGLDRALLGSVAEKVVRLSPTSVLSVRSPEEA